MAEKTAIVLEGSRCTVCTTVAFPAGVMCSKCATPTAAPLNLSTRGVLWAYTIQRFPPKSPPYVPPAGGFTPFAVGYIELPEGIKVEAIIDCEDFHGLDQAPVTLVATSPVPRFAVDRDTELGEIK
jgi:uncharacterized OB-fold protein